MVVQLRHSELKCTMHLLQSDSLPCSSALTSALIVNHHKDWYPVWWKRREKTKSS